MLTTRRKKNSVNLITHHVVSSHDVKKFHVVWLQIHIKIGLWRRNFSFKNIFHFQFTTWGELSAGFCSRMNVRCSTSNELKAWKNKTSFFCLLFNSFISFGNFSQTRFSPKSKKQREWRERMSFGKARGSFILFLTRIELFVRCLEGLRELK